MLLILKLASFTIWFIIMIFIISAVIRKRASIRVITPYLFNKTENKPKLYSEREKI